MLFLNPEVCNPEVLMLLIYSVCYCFEYLLISGFPVTLLFFLRGYIYVLWFPVLLISAHAR
jgi:hypothetical protein